MGTTNGAAGSLPQRVKQFYERVGVEREAALVELAELYTEDVEFANPVVDERGLREFEEMWRRALRMYSVFRFEGIEVAGDDRYFTMTYQMVVRFPIGPEFRSPIATDAYGRDGKVGRTRDYFDVVGMLLAPFPPLSWAYKKIFGVLVA